MPLKTDPPTRKNNEPQINNTLENVHERLEPNPKSWRFLRSDDGPEFNLVIFWGSKSLILKNVSGSHDHSPKKQWRVPMGSWKGSLTPKKGFTTRVIPEHVLVRLDDTVDERNPANHLLVNNGINYQPQLVSRISEPSTGLLYIPFLQTFYKTCRLEMIQKR